MDKLENAVLCNMWNNILERFNRVSVALQAVNLDLFNTVCLVQSLREYISGLRNQFGRFEMAAKRCPQQYPIFIKQINEGTLSLNGLRVG